MSFIQSAPQRSSVLGSDTPHTALSLPPSSDCFWVIDAQGRHLFTNSLTKSILGYGREELLALGPLVNLVHEDDRPRVRASIDALLRSPSRRSASVTLRVREKSGTWRHCEATGVNMLEVEGVNGIVVTARNVAEKPVTPVRPRRWLIVDDDEGVTASLRFGLEDAGDEVESMSNAEGLVEKVASWAPDVILLDVELGDSNGVEIQRALRRAGLEIPVILMSGRAYVSPDELVARSAFLTKPFGVAELFLTAERLRLAAAPDA
jgi:PAS domain S-box-containing protein